MNKEERLKYPEPNFIRKNTKIINDGWLFSFNGKDWNKINLPYCPESKLSGIGYTDFILQCYYRKKLNVKKIESRIVIHFGAVDYRCELYINEKYIGGHVGGFTPFSFDITDALNLGDNEIYLVVHDNEINDCPSGKQSPEKDSFGCFYTRTTGIWQNVWLEYVPNEIVELVHFFPSVKNNSVMVELRTNAVGNCKIEVFYNEKVVGAFCGIVAYSDTLEILLSEKHLWKLGNGYIYDVKILFNDDEVYSYFGLRNVEYRDYEFFINDKSVFQKLVLDQGYYPDGIYTTTSERMEKDIKLALDLGFNGARLHQKVFDPQFLYLCDINGYMVWGEFPSWGCDYTDLHFLGRFLQEWEEVLERDFNHPAIVTWCPLNEVFGKKNGENYIKRDVRFIELVYNFTKNYDSTRPCIDVSGGHHGHTTDVFDVHCYDENIIKDRLLKLESKGILDFPGLYNSDEDIIYNSNLPVNLSEIGGIKFLNNSQSDNAWGYGKIESNANDFIERYENLIDILFNCKKISGFCYTQLYDVEQEENGFYFYDRSDKLSNEEKERIRKINERK